MPVMKIGGMGTLSKILMLTDFFWALPVQFSTKFSMIRLMTCFHNSKIYHFFHKIFFSNFSCMFINLNIFFLIWIWIFLIYETWETSRNKLKKHSIIKNCSDLIYWINCSSDLKLFANSRPSVSNGQPRLIM